MGWSGLGWDRSESIPTYEHFKSWGEVRWVGLSCGGVSLSPTYEEFLKSLGVGGVGGVMLDQMYGDFKILLAISENTVKTQWIFGVRILSFSQDWNAVCGRGF